VRALTIVNLLLWIVLFLGWIPYTMAAGWADPASIEVRWILAITAGLQLLLFGVRLNRHRPVLG
jgi:hypothetical protein